MERKKKPINYRDLLRIFYWTRKKKGTIAYNKIDEKRRLRNKDEKTKLSFFAKFNRNKLFTRFLINNINIIYHVYFLNIVPFEPGTLYFVEGEWD